jgi:hypothetical protein
MLRCSIFDSWKRRLIGQFFLDILFRPYYCQPQDDKNVEEIFAFSRDG